METPVVAKTPVTEDKVLEDSSEIKVENSDKIQKLDPPA